MTQRRKLSTGAPNPKYKPGASGKSGKSGKTRPHGSGRTLSAFVKARFVAWDGEGADIDGKHCYILLQNSDGNRIASTSATLTTESCLSFLIEHSQQQCINVCFASGYDINMMLGDLTRDEITRLWNGEHLDWHQYNLSYRPRKEFVVRQFNPAHKWRLGRTGQYERVYTHIFRLWDVFGYFQSSFVVAIRSWLPNFPVDDLGNIQSHKLERSNFNTSQMAEISEYTRLECDALVQLMDILRGYAQKAELVLRRWDGAGSVAAAMLAKHNIKPHLKEADSAVVNEYSRYAYAGGRIELLRYGHYSGRIYAYDIRSAYPAAMLTLPSLDGGQWRYSAEFIVGSFGAWSVGYDFELGQGIYPFFTRSPQGHISYPTSGNGIYWTSEVEAGLQFARSCPRNSGEQSINISGGYYFCPTTTVKPLQMVGDYYRLRDEWKRQGEGAQLLLKLGLNSLYGKFAQQVGGYHGSKPPFHNLLYAGAITASTRARLFLAALQNLPAIVFIATDGIISTEPLDLPIGRDLGDWECSEYAGVTAVQAGVYWLHKDDGTSVAKYRGFDADSLSVDAIRNAWESGQTSYTASSSRFVG